jgi:hypothetical protein
MVSLLDIRNHIKRDMFIEGDAYNGRIDDCIRMAINMREGDMFWFLERIASLALIAGSNIIELPADVAVVQRLRLSYVGSMRNLDEWSYADLSKRYYLDDNVSDGTPQAFARLNRTLYFSHKSASDVIISMQYCARDAILPTDDTDMSIWFEREGYDLVRSQARYLYETQVGDNPNASDLGVTAAMQTLNERNRKIRSY